MSNKPAPYLLLADVLKWLKESRAAVVKGDMPFMMAGQRHPALVPCALLLGKGGAGNVHKNVSRGGVPVIVAKSGAKGDSVITLDDALETLEGYKAKLGTDDVPFLAVVSPYPDFQLCDVWKQAAGATDLYRRVSRGGRDVMVVELTVPSKK
jgi:hypothetical protein